MELVDRVRRTIKADDLVRAGARVLVAVSGGSDSVALAYLLRELEAAGDLTVAALAHFNHQLRPTAAADERFCETLAARLAYGFVSGTANVAERAATERRSIEDAARAARHEFLERARRETGADVVALGHTRDDQAETFLLRLVRGAGARGLAGMHPRHGALVRPLIDCRRSDLRTYLHARQVPYVHDESNDDVRIPRNRVRAELLPLIERRFNPAIVDVLADEAEIARDEWRWMDAAARDAAAALVQGDKDQWKIDASALSRLPPALGRLALRIVMTEAAGGAPLSFRHVDEVLRLARDSGPAIDLPGQHVERRGADVVLTSRKARAANLFRYPLSIPGEVQLRESLCVVSAETARSADEAGAILGTGPVAVVRLDRCREPLTVRNRRPGDRFRPLGLAGRKKLQDYFVDRKVARHRRDRVPLVVDETDRIVWVAGHAIADEFRVTDPAQAVLILRLRQV
jgi:tRNA(Ile)-lysidine synthase